jgi:rod shape-determining protein MreD
LENQSGWKVLRIPVFLLVAFWLQTSLGQLVPRQTAEWIGYIDWLLLLTVYVGLQRNSVRSILTALFAGILLDSSSYGGAIGVAGFSYLLVAYLIYWITTRIAVDNIRVRIGAVTVASFVNTAVRLLFYRLLDVQIPVLAGGEGILAAFVLGVLLNLCASTLFYILLDRIFLQGDPLRRRRTAALRRRM